MNIYWLIIVGFMLVHVLFKSLVNQLNIRSAQQGIPSEFHELYDHVHYQKSQAYLKRNESFALVKRMFFVTIMLLFLWGDGLRVVDQAVQVFALNSVQHGVVYLVALMLVLALLKIPFAYYHTFVIEQAFGFNQTTRRTFVADTVKSLILTAILGLPLLSLVLSFFDHFGQNAWFYVLVAVALYQLAIMFMAPVVIMPLFNRFSPLEEGELKQEIETYASQHQFGLKGIFTMDGSKRSNKSNAFFTGFGRMRRIILFDTLIQKLSTQELMAVLAHEMGHCKRGHIWKSTVRSLIVLGVSLWVLSLCLSHGPLFESFGFASRPVYVGLVLFSLIFAPLEFVMVLIAAILSRRNEYEADRYSIETYRQPQAMIEALKKLSVDHLSNLTPHPWKVFLEYSHPPVVDRIKAIRSIFL